MNSLNEDERTKTLALSIASNKNLKCKPCKTVPFLKLNSGHIRLELLHNHNMKLLSLYVVNARKMEGLVIRALATTYV